MRLLKFVSSNCIACRLLDESLIPLSGNALVKDIKTYDTLADQPISIYYGVTRIPCLILIEDSGKEIKRLVGSIDSQQLLNFLK